MNTIEILREMSEIWSLFSDMPDDATIGVDLAALYLGVSVKTLARYRQNGDGPPYVQYQSSESKARNQRVNYLLGDLRAWRNNHRVSSTMQAAQVRGMTFIDLKDLTKSHPFWVYESFKIIDHALCLSEEKFRFFLLNTEYEIIWVSIEEVLLRQWGSSVERRKWHTLMEETLKMKIKNTLAQQEKHELLEMLV
ncbi:hypothetical protein [Pantoea agglomerans]|uniref:hypothetical protein n=1 Tax=Enterobacter agglomerans TaxID=549 RepID=UPI0006DD3D84|nr:hypothetical protein [Pantoea agglomerans]KPA06245.1 hypothetical protein PAP10c_2347 [Pantoea agglomerans]